MEPHPDKPPFPFSRETTIRLDRDGVFWHDGQRLGHPGLQRAFATWVDVDPETGRYILKNAINWCFLAVEDTPLLVRGVSEVAGGLALALSDGTTERLDPATLRVDGDEVPYCDVRGGRLPARFTTGAAFALLERARSEGGDLILALPDGEVRVRRVPAGQGGARRSV